LREHLGQLRATEEGKPLDRALIEPVIARLQALASVGLAGLAPARKLNELGSGQAQRVLLASGLGTALVNMLYVLDEPASGLHPADAAVALDALRQLHARGNTLVVVEHQPAWLLAADRVVELGPGAGGEGGQIIYDGLSKELRQAADSPTGQHLAGRRGFSWAADKRRSPRGWLELEGASGRNLKSVNVRFPLGCFCVVTGVSGAGKSTLVRDTLLPLLAARLGQPAAEALPAVRLAGERSLEQVVWIDAAPLPRTARSVPATVVGAWDEIRKLVAATPEAQAAGLKPGSFSFNVAGGRCPRCAGTGRLTVDMQFLADVTMVCDECHGRRFQPAVLKARYRGLDIAAILNLTADEAFPFFRGQPRIQAALRSLKEAGLEYLRLGQPLDTLSHGETQRLRLALRLASPGRKRTLFLLDQPTAGLHMDDVTRLVDSLNALLDIGHSLVMMDHAPQLWAHADWIIDLGPGADGAGGEVVSAGPPEQLVAEPRSVTGRYLREYMEQGSRSKP
jgi:excinuclease ABC subunit A